MKTTLFKAFAFITLPCLISFSVTAQNVGVNATGAAPDGGAMLDVAATNKGLLIPRVSIANLATIAPITGSTTTSLLVYNTNATTGQGFYYWDGAQWVKFFTGDAWQLTGNAGTNATTNFLGTTDNVDLSIRRNSVERVRLLNTTTSFMDEIQTRDGGANSGDILVRIYDSNDDGIIDVYENNAMNHRIHGNGVTVFNEQGNAINDFRIESDAQANIFFVDAGSNEIGIRNAAPGNMLEMTNGGQNVGANSMANFENQGVDGVALAARNTSTTSGYNAFEGITDFSGTGFTPAGVLGLGISATVTHRAIGVRGVVNGRDGIGVLGSRQSGVGTTGWGGLFLNNLGYTGGFFNASDNRLKKNVTELNSAIGIIEKLRAVSYNYDTEKYPNMGLSEKLDYGFIAQELKEILPNVVSEMSIPVNGTAVVEANSKAELNFESFYMVDYTRLIPIAIKGIQEQQKLIEKQNKKIEALEKMLLELQQKMDK